MAISATLKVSVDDLKKSSAKFGTLATEVQKLTDSMLKLIEGTKSIWEGEAQSAYWKKFEGLKDDMTKIFKMIDEYRADLSEIAQTYEQAETDNKAAAGSLNDTIIS